MNWDAIGAIGEVAGAATVIATLFYLSRQIRQSSAALDRSNDYARATAIHDTNSLYSQLYLELARDEELASIYHRAQAQESLNEIETVRFVGFLNAYFAWLEDLYIQALADLSFPGLEDRDADYLIEATSPCWFRLLDTESGRHWWTAYAAHQFSPDFHEGLRRVAEGKISLPAE